jgi:ATP-dependent DNA helicase RecQ/Werner syndrome ATP-dependent helicase
MSLDDFGDDSFLNDFDPDAAVAEHRKTVCNPYVTKRTFDADSMSNIKRSKQDSDSFDVSNHLKRQKSTTDATLNDYHHSPNPWDEASLTSTLFKHFGYSSFRPGQYQVVNALLSGRDCVVFWSTGRGKSITYQIPPLHTNKISLIVSPLISLMEDQVSKLNGLLRDENNPNEIAVYLGSAQTDLFAERRALDGEYSIIYCTPEKLVQSSFLEELGQMHLKGKQRNRELCLIAIDEAHCVSEWGHDFRKDYRKVGEMLRSHSVLSKIPIVALTATAVPKVQNDILASLRLRNPLVAQQSFDRENLIISVQKKPTGGYKAALASFVKDMKEMIAQNKNESTVVYCPTRNMVEEISEWLCSQLKCHRIDVQPYHAGLSNAVRSEAHINFLIGKTLIIVATIAFGMGIDKSDIRRVIHYGAPKTVEEYYQQIGRAGRDGLAAHCIMFYSSNDFDAYKSDFYLGNLNATVRASQERSIEALRRYATNDEVCRRAELLHFFNEVPKFGQRCGTCDNCQTRNSNIDDIERDFGDNGARLILYALSILNDRQGTGTLEKILNGNKVDTHRYKNVTVIPDDVCKTIKMMRSLLSGYKKRVPVSYFSKDLLPALVNRGYVQVLQQKSIVSGRYNVSTLQYTFDFIQ